MIINNKYNLGDTVWYVCTFGEASRTKFTVRSKLYDCEVMGIITRCSGTSYELCEDREEGLCRIEMEEQELYATEELARAKADLNEKESKETWERNK